MAFQLSIPPIALTNPNRVHQFVEDVLQPFMERSVEFLRSEVEPLIHVGATGRLKDELVAEVLKRGVASPEALHTPVSIAVRGSSSAELFRGVVYTRAENNGFAYVKSVEYGQRPHWIPIDALREWAELHGLNPYAVQTTIARKGTEGQYMFRRAYEAAYPQIRLDWQQTIGRMAYLLRKP